MILGDVEETVTTIVIDDETYEEIYKVCLSSVLFFSDCLPVFCSVLFLSVIKFFLS